MEVARYVQGIQNRKLVTFLQYIKKKVLQLLFCSIVMQNIQIFLEGRIMFIVTCCSFFSFCILDCCYEVDVISKFNIHSLNTCMFSFYWCSTVFCDTSTMIFVCLGNKLIVNKRETIAAADIKLTF